MKVDREMEILLNEIPLLHHGGLLGGSEAAGADDDADLSFLIHELAAMGVVDGDDEPPAPGAAAAMASRRRTIDMRAQRGALACCKRRWRVGGVDV